MSMIAWQGWQLRLPASWNPVKLEGDYDAGVALFADLNRPRLGLKWERAKSKKVDPARWINDAMQREVGLLAAAEAGVFALPGWSEAKLYIEPNVPGRDVWIGRSEVSGRVLSIIHHARRRDSILAESILPRLCDLSIERAMPWSIFGLSCLAPAGFSLVFQKLHAGDLSLTFARGRQRLSIRQIAVAHLALKRLSLDAWLAEQQKQQRKYFKPVGEVSDFTLGNAGATPGAGRMREARRRRRHFYLRTLPASLFTLVIHDGGRDRLVLIESDDRAIIEQVLPDIGWAQRRSED